MLTYNLALKFKSRGYEVLLTARRYDYIGSLLKLLRPDFNVKIVGGYGESLEDKLREDLKRSLKLLEILKCWKPDILVSYPSPSSFRVAYGLKIPIVMLTDSPHSTIVNRLTLPLASALVISDAIRGSWVEMFGGETLKVYTYYGVDEVEYVKGFKPKREVLEYLKVKPLEFFVLRPPEVKASYYNFKPLNLELLIKELSQRGRIVFFPRYKSQELEVKEKFGEEIIIPRRAVDTLSLYYYCKAVISGGASMAREAALIGIPSVYFYPEPLEVNVWLSKIGFPIYHARSIEDILGFLDRELEKMSRSVLIARARELISKLECPSKVLEEAVRECLG